MNAHHPISEIKMVVSVTCNVLLLLSIIIKIIKIIDVSKVILYLSKIVPSLIMLTLSHSHVPQSVNLDTSKMLQNTSVRDVLRLVFPVWLL